MSHDCVLCFVLVTEAWVKHLNKTSLHFDVSSSTEKLEERETEEDKFDMMSKHTGNETLSTVETETLE